MSPAADVAKASFGLGSTWETMKIAVKPYPSCRYSHAALDGIAHLRGAAGLEVGEEWVGVTGVQIGLPAAVSQSKMSHCIHTHLNINCEWRSDEAETNCFPTRLTQWFAFGQPCIDVKSLAAYIPQTGNDPCR